MSNEKTNVLNKNMARLNGPITLYKYQGVNEYSINGLKDQKLWKADPFSFNDPFELRLMQLADDEIYGVRGLDKLRRENPGFTHLSDQELYYLAISGLQNEFYNLRVTCFTEKNNNLLMWAHYGASHSGFCLGFEIPEDNESLHKVNYQDDYPIIDLENVLNITGTAKILLNKSSHWSYENEWRMIFIEPTTNFTDYPGRFAEIILGSRISEKNEEQIRQILKKSNVKIKKAFLHPKKYELTIE